MKYLTLLLALSLTHLSLNAFAGGGGGIGNGGNAVVCRDSSGNIKSAEVLDIFEARVLRGIQLKLGDPGLSVEENLQILYSRLAFQSPNRAASYKVLLDSFKDNANFMVGVSLVELNDSENVVLPDGCIRIQLIIQQVPKFPEDKRFLVNKDIWDLLDNQNRAVIMFHEAILNEMMKTHDWFCTPDVNCSWELETAEMRYFLSKIFSDQIHALTTQQFHDLQKFVPYLFRVEVKELDADLLVIENQTDIGAGLGSHLAAIPSWPIFQYDSLGRPLKLYVSPFGCGESEFLNGRITSAFNNHPHITCLFKNVKIGLGNNVYPLAEVNYANRQMTISPNLVFSSTGKWTNISSSQYLDFSEYSTNYFDNIYPQFNVSF